MDPVSLYFEAKNIDSKQRQAAIKNNIKDNHDTNSVA